MTKVIYAIVILVVLFLIRDYFQYSEYTGVLNIGILGGFIYLIVAIVSLVKNSSASNKKEESIEKIKAGKTSGCLWLFGIAAMVLLIFFIKQTLGKYSFDTFVFLDNLVGVSHAVSPLIAWGLLGLLAGAVYGSIVAWKKYKLNFAINLIPIGFFLLVLSVLVLVSNPNANKPAINEAAPKVEPGIDSTINLSIKKFIVNRWVVEDVLGKNRKNFLKRKNKTISELEFKKNGKCYLNENGVVTGFLYYSIDADNKSILFTESKKNAISKRVQIISMTKDKMTIVSELFQNDTTILRRR